MEALNTEISEFEGISAKECEAFISAVRRRALHAGKHLDNQWMAYFASSFFIGDALYWYEDQDEKVKGDWDYLRPAMLARFGRSQPSASPATVPTPAAAPPNSKSSRKGRLRVFDIDGRFLGFISGRINPDGRLYNLCDTISEAISIEISYAVSSKLCGIHILSGSPGDDVTTQLDNWLGLTWQGLTSSNWIDSSSNRFANFCSLSMPLSDNTRAAERIVWEIQENGELGAQYPKPDGSYQPLESRLQLRLSFLNWFRPIDSVGDRYKRVRVVFEENN